MPRPSRLLPASLALALGIGGLAGTLTGTAAAAAPASARGAERVDPAVATGTGGAVASTDLDASQAGIATLKAGGNAVDAAVAMAATLGVTEPFVAGPGGGGFMVIYLAKSRTVVTIDGRETCPAGCTPKRFVNPRTNQPLDFEFARHSGISVGVPGHVAQWQRAVDSYGTRTLAADLQPAIAAATDGFTVDRHFRYEEYQSLKDLQAFSSSRKLFLKNGQPLAVGSTLRNPDLARTYRMIAKYGADYLYRGPLATAIARTVQHPPVYAGTSYTVLPGDMTRGDLARYVAKVRPPTHITYRGRDVYSMAPPSSGGTTVGEALNILSGYDLGAEPRALALHHYLEASRYAFADRNAYVGDRDYVPVPLRGLLSKGFAATRRCLITDTAATSPVAPGDPHPPYAPCRTTGAPAPSVREGMHTNHLVAADAAGNVVSYTNTIEELAGSGITVPGYGFLLNNELTDFNFAPSAPGAYAPNLPAPGKRPRSSLSPTIVMKDGRPDFTLGSPGGATIITTVLQTLINKIDFGMSLPAAIAAPRASQENTAQTLAEPEFVNSRTGNLLQSKYGQQFDVLEGPSLFDREIGSVAGITFLPGGRFQAAAEPVRLGGGSALVVHPEG